MELTALTEALDVFEAEVSAQRRRVFAELDALTDELVGAIASSRSKES